VIGASAGFVFGLAAYYWACRQDIMTFGYEIMSAGIVCAILGAGVDWLVRAFREKGPPRHSRGTSDGRK